MSVQPAGEKPLPAPVRRLLSIITFLGGVLFVSLSLWLIQETSPLRQPSDHPSPLAAVDFQRLDVPCPPWVAPDRQHFLCVREGILHVGTLGEEEMTSLLPLATVEETVWDVVWLSPTRALVLLQPLEETSDAWPLYWVDLSGTAATPAGAALPGTSLQPLPGGLAYRSANGDLNVLSVDGQRASIPLGAPSTLYPFVLDEARVFLDEKEPRFVARLIAGGEAGVLSLYSFSSRDDTVLDIHAVRGVRTFAWAPHRPLLAFVTQSRQEGTPSLLWAFDATKQARRLVWEAPGPGDVDFLTWLPSGTLLFAFLPSPYKGSSSATYYAWKPETSRPTLLFRNGHGLQLVDEKHILVYREASEGEARAGFWLVRLAVRPSP